MWFQLYYEKVCILLFYTTAWSYVLFRTCINFCNRHAVSLIIPDVIRVLLSPKKESLHPRSLRAFFPECSGWSRNELTQITVHVCFLVVLFYSQQRDFVGLSFPTISSVGPNAAIIHYRYLCSDVSEVTVHWAALSLVTHIGCSLTHVVCKSSMSSSAPTPT